MKDDRVRIFRIALQELIESLQATVRVNRWTGDEIVPEPLKESASRLVARLGAVDRLASSTFNGSPADKVRVVAMCSSMRKLDAAYLAYRQRLERAPTEQESAAMALDAEIDEVRAAAAP